MLVAVESDGGEALGDDRVRVRAPGAPWLPSSSCRLACCLGQGEHERCGPAPVGNAGHPQVWDILGAIAGGGRPRQPRREDARVAGRLRCKLDLRSRLRSRGARLVVVCVAGVYQPGGARAAMGRTTTRCSETAPSASSGPPSPTSPSRSTGGSAPAARRAPGPTCEPRGRHHRSAAGGREQPRHALRHCACGGPALDVVRPPPRGAPHRELEASSPLVPIPAEPHRETGKLVLVPVRGLHEQGEAPSTGCHVRVVSVWSPAGSRPSSRASSGRSARRSPTSLANSIRPTPPSPAHRPPRRWRGRGPCRGWS